MTKSIEWGWLELFDQFSRDLCFDGPEKALDQLDDTELEMCWHFWNYGCQETAVIIEREVIRRGMWFQPDERWKTVKFENDLFRCMPYNGGE